MDRFPNGREAKAEGNEVYTKNTGEEQRDGETLSGQ